MYIPKLIVHMYCITLECMDLNPIQGNSLHLHLQCAFTLPCLFLPRVYVHVYVTVAGASLYTNRAAEQYNRRPIANNGLIIANSDDDIRLVCVSNSSQPDVGEIAGLDGTTLTSSNNGWFVNRGGNIPGFICATKLTFTAGDQGIYTCTISDDNGNAMIINVGLYPTTFSGECIE